MTSFLTVFAIVTIAAVTPGPNNFIVMSAAARGGTHAALSAIAGVIGGSIALLLVIWTGTGTLFQSMPEIQSLFRILGAIYLIWLGVCLIRTAHSAAEAMEANGLPQSVIGVAGFQMLNPKSWVLVLTAISAMGSSVQDVALLAALFVVVMGACLTLWSLIGQLISRWLMDRRSKYLFDVAMGILLIASAATLFI